MTDNTQPEALRLADDLEASSHFPGNMRSCNNAAAAELRRQHARIAELEAELEAIKVRSYAYNSGWKDGYKQGAWAAQQPSPTTPAEQQATKETSGGFHVWRDISTAPKDGSRFVATGHNYGLYSEVRHACVAQWFRDCWMEVSDWNETSELKYLTHWMPLPSPPDDVAAPAEQQAAPKAAPGEQLTRGQIREVFMAHGFTIKEGQADLKQYVYDAAHALLELVAAPQQEAQEPCQTCTATARTVMLDQVSFDRKPDCYGIRQITDDDGIEEWEDIRTSPDVAREEARDMMATGRGEIYEVVPLWTTPQPAPAPLSDEQIDDLIAAKHFHEGYELTASVKVLINWYRLGLRDGERAHGITQKGGSDG